jgi:Ca-activated chloride channel family protein
VYWWPLAAALLVSRAYLAAVLLADTLSAHRRNSERPATAASTAWSIAPLGLAGSLNAFHFIRPAWLVLLVPAALLWWFLRQKSDSGRAWRRIVAPHLLEHLWGSEPTKRRFRPVAGLALAWLVTILAVAGPTWRQEPSAFAEETAALAVVVKVSPSMMTEDLLPSRLERAALKLHDLIAARGDAKTSLIAYAGTAHRVMPQTKDAGIIDTFAQALDPDIMPEDGDAAAAALGLADASLAEAGGGSIVWITDSVAPEQAALLADWRKSSSTRVWLWPPLYEGEELDALETSVRRAGPSIVQFAADDSDVARLAGAAKFAATAGSESDTRWAETGYWLTPLLVLFTLPFFRRGWVVRLSRAS